MRHKIPFNKPFVVGQELYYIAQSVLSGHTAGDGSFSKKCQVLMEETFGAKKILLTTSCTAALEMAAMLLDVGPGDEVILPSYTFVSTANAFLLRGASLRFVDIREDTLNLDENLVEENINERTKAIVPVHYAGVSCEMDLLCTLAKRYSVSIVEDAAQGVNARYGDRFLGTIGDIGTYSFHETKNYTCGEGGAIVINRADLTEKAEILREKGTDRSKFFRGQVDKYTWVDVGSSYLPSDLLAAFLCAQLEHMDEILERRKKLFWGYHDALMPLQELGFIRLPTIPAGRFPNYHMFYIILADKNKRPELIQHLHRAGILAVFHYIPLHTAPVGRRLDIPVGTLPVTENLSERLLRLPMYYELTLDQVQTVASEVFAFFDVKPG